jgi:tetratricopeptide (TPR) repeat protein
MRAAALLAEGQALWQRGELAAGAECARAAIAAGSQAPQAYLLLGDCCLGLRQFESAANAYAQALALAPDNPYARFLCGEALFHLGRYADTVAMLSTLDPGDDPALAMERAITLGRAYHLTGQLELAEVNLLNAYVGNPQSENAAYNLAVFYEQEYRHATALQFLEPAARLHPQSAQLHYNLGVNLAFCGRTKHAVEAFETTLRIDPLHLQAHQNLALNHLRQGDLARAWPHYAWRFNRHQSEGGQAGWTPSTATLPADLRGHNIALWGEQGIGDELFFLRYLPALKRRGATISYHPGCPRLLPLILQLRHQRLLDRLVPDQTPARPDVDAINLLIGDLPLALGAPDSSNFPPSLSFCPAPDATVRWCQRLPALAAPRVRLGLTWRAGTTAAPQTFETHRWLSKEVPLEQLLDLLMPLDVDIVVLQRNPHAQELACIRAKLGNDRCIDASAFDQDLSELLGLLSMLDGLVGVSNTNVHLMAALGKGGNILVPHPAEFRWQEHGPRSAWFDGFGVYRQEAGGDWSAPLDRLAKHLASHHPAR